MLAILFGLAGIHGAVQQSVEKSLAAELLPKANRGSGFGVLATVNGVGDLISSVVVGVLWSSVSPNAGFIYAGFFTLLGAILDLFLYGASSCLRRNAAALRAPRGLPSSALLRRRRLALRAKMAAASRHDDAANDRAAAKTFFAVVLVGAMPAEIRRGRHPRPHNRKSKSHASRIASRKMLLHGAMQPPNSSCVQASRQVSRMNFRAPQTFIGINITDAAQHASDRAAAP